MLMSRHFFSVLENIIRLVGFQLCQYRRECNIVALTDRVRLMFISLLNRFYPANPTDIPMHGTCYVVSVIIIISSSSI